MILIKKKLKPLHQKKKNQFNSYIIYKYKSS